MPLPDDPAPLRYASPTTAPATLPTRAGTVAMILFLLSLGMLFFVSILGYVLIRTRSAQSPPLGAIQIPAGLFLSTALVIAGSFTMHFAVRDVRQEKLAQLRNWLLITLGISIVFLLLQAVFLRELLARHAESQSQGIVLYGLIFFLVLLHGLHVVGGVVSLILVYIGARLGKYDHEHFYPVRNAALYWHFLDGVWLTMFAIFVILR
jgi:cytochrome c oxidase subunit 3